MNHLSRLRRWLNASPWRWLLVVFPVFAAAVVFAGRGEEPKGPKPPIANYSQLDARLRDGKVKQLKYDPNSQTLQVTEKSRRVPPYQLGVPALNGPEGLSRTLRLARAKKVSVKSRPLQSSDSTLRDALLRTAPPILILLLLAYLARDYLPVGRKKIEAVTSNVKFDQVAGCGEAIEELQDVRAFLADQSKYARLGAKVPKGVLLYGPPGTGKTLLAKAVASEADVPFFQVSGAEFVEMYVGLGAKRVREVFDQAKQAAPAIIFIDELDAIGGKRSPGGGDAGTREGDQTLNQLLTEIDGFTPQKDPLIVMGATNRLETLDAALLRPGRFDRHIAIDPPDRHGRLDILRVHAADKRLSDEVDLEEMAVHSSGMTGADLAHWLNEAALLAARENHDAVTASDIEDAYFRIVAGAKKQHRALSESERRSVAFHEAGHAIIGERLKSSERVHKISIIPRGRSGGQTIRVAEEDVFLYSQEHLADTICMLLAGRAAEELVNNELTSGAHDDLQRATAIALKMVTKLGMGEELGLRVIADDGSDTLSPQVQAQVDEEVRGLLTKEHARAAKLLSNERPALDRLAAALLEEETLDRERFVELLDEPPAA